MKTILLKSFRSDFKGKMFLRLKQQLKECRGKDIILIGNYKTGRFDYDAIVITPSDLFAFQFTDNSGDTIIVNDNVWVNKEDGSIVFSGSKTTNPYDQMRWKRNILHRHLYYFGVSFIKTVLVFPQLKDVVKGETRLNLVNHSWFLMSSAQDMAQTIKSSTSSTTIDYQRLLYFFRRKKAIYCYSRLSRFWHRTTIWLKNQGKAILPFPKTVLGQVVPQQEI